MVTIRGYALQGITANRYHTSYFSNSQNASGPPTAAQKTGQAQVVAGQPVVAPLAVTKAVFVPYGLQDDLNACYPASGSDFTATCVDTTAYLCANVSCEVRTPRPTCLTWNASHTGLENGCRWGLGPISELSVRLR